MPAVREFHADHYEKKKRATHLIPDLFRANTKFRSLILYLVNKIKPAQALRPE